MLIVAPSVEPAIERDWCAFGSNASISNLNFAHATARARIIQHDFPRLRLRIAFDTGNRYNMIENAAAQLRANHAQSFIGGGLFLRQRRRDQKQERPQAIST